MSHRLRRKVAYMIQGRIAPASERLVDGNDRREVSYGFIAALMPPSCISRNEGTSRLHPLADAELHELCAIGLGYNPVVS